MESVLCVAAPLLMAGFLLLRPVAASAAATEVGGVLAPLLSLLLLAHLAWSGGEDAWPLPADRLALIEAMLASTLGVAAAVVAMRWTRVRRMAGWRVPAAHGAALQVVLGLALLGMLAAGPAGVVAAGAGVVLAGVVGAAACGAREAMLAWRRALPVLAAALLALGGAAMLGGGWDARAGGGVLPVEALPGAARAGAEALLLCGLLSLGGLAPLHGGAGTGSSPAAALCALLRPVLALGALLRLRAESGGTALPVGAVLVGVGLLSVLLGAAGLAAGVRGGGGAAAAIAGREAGERRAPRLTALAGAGVTAVAFGLGGAGAVFAGVLHLLLHGLAQGSGWFGRLASPHGDERVPLLLSELVPAGPFCGALLVLVEAARVAPGAALLLGLGLGVGGVTLLGRDGGTRRSGVVPLALVVLSGLLSLAMPPPAADWLTMLGGALGGAPGGVVGR